MIEQAEDALIHRVQGDLGPGTGGVFRTWTLICTVWPGRQFVALGVTVRARRLCGSSTLSSQQPTRNSGSFTSRGQASAPRTSVTETKTLGTSPRLQRDFHQRGVAFQAQEERAQHLFPFEGHERPAADRRLNQELRGLAGRVKGLVGLEFISTSLR